MFKHTLANPTTGRSVLGSTAHGDDTANVERAELVEQSSVSPRDLNAETKIKRSVSSTPFLVHSTGKSYKSKQTLGGRMRLLEGVILRDWLQRVWMAGRTSLMIAIPLALVSASAFLRVARRGSV